MPAAGVVIYKGAVECLNALLPALTACKYVIVNTVVAVAFEWDDEGAASYFAKHGVSFEPAGKVWNNPLYVLLLPDPVEGGQ